MGRWVKQDVPVHWLKDTDELVLAGYRWSEDERWALVPTATHPRKQDSKYALILISVKLTAVYVNTRAEAEELLTEFAKCSTKEIDKDRFSDEAKVELRALMSAINTVRGSFLIS